MVDEWGNRSCKSSKSSVRSESLRLNRISKKKWRKAWKSSLSLSRLLPTSRHPKPLLQQRSQKLGCSKEMQLKKRDRPYTTRQSTFHPVVQFASRKESSNRSRTSKSRSRKNPWQNALSLSRVHLRDSKLQLHPQDQRERRLPRSSRKMTILHHAAPLATHLSASSQMSLGTRLQRRASNRRGTYQMDEMIQHCTFFGVLVQIPGHAQEENTTSS